MPQAIAWRDWRTGTYRPITSDSTLPTFADERNTDYAAARNRGESHNSALSRIYGRGGGGNYDYFESYGDSLGDGGGD